MSNSKKLSVKLTLASALTMMSVSLLNIQTAYGVVTPGGVQTVVRPADPTPGTQVRPGPAPRPPGPVRPNPSPAPRPPGPVRPDPSPRPPGPVRPLPPRPFPGPVYPGPIYPGPVYPGPVYPPPPVNYVQYQTAHINRFVIANEVFYVNQLVNSYYGYNYRLRSIRIDVSGDAQLSVSLLANGRMVDSRYTSGNNVYLSLGYYNYDINSLTIQMSGYAFVHSMIFEFERYY